MLYQSLSYAVTNAFREVKQELGSGLLELPYHNAMFIALKDKGLIVEKEKPYPVYFRGQMVGSYFADIVVNNKIILEVKAVKAITHKHEAQVLNYLYISGLKIGYILNFSGQKQNWLRLVL